MKAISTAVEQVQRAGTSVPSAHPPSCRFKQRPDAARHRHDEPDHVQKTSERPAQVSDVGQTVPMKSPIMTAAMIARSPSTSGTRRPT